MSQFKALSEKNWILWKRGLCGNIIEVVVPIIFIAFIAVIRNLVPIETFEEQSFIGNANYSYNIYGQQSTALANNGSVMLKRFNLTNTGCRPGMVVGLAPSGNSFVTTLDTNLQSLGYSTEQFDSDTSINNRVRSA